MDAKGEQTMTMVAFTKCNYYMVWDVIFTYCSS